MEPLTIYLFAGSNGAGKSTFARAYLTTGFDTPPRFLNADELAKGLSPLAPETVALKAGKLLLAEIGDCLERRTSFALESTLSGHAQAAILKKAKELGYQIEIHYLWIPSPTLAIRRIAQRVKKGGHHVPSVDVRRRYQRSLENFVKVYTPLADDWLLWDNTLKPAALLLDSRKANLSELKSHCATMKSSWSSAPKKTSTDSNASPAERGLAASKIMGTELTREHKRWNMPLLAWKNGKIAQRKA